MQRARSASGSDQRCDLLIAGGGVVGLWMARLASDQGLSVVLVDAGAIGAGASGGILGALMPHAPERWNGKKQFQFEALLSLEPAIACLETETGLSTGYGRIGRLMPLGDQRQLERAREREDDAARNWQGDGRNFHWTVHSSATENEWLVPDAAPAGVVFDDLSARLDPRRLCAALRTSLEARPNVSMIEHDGLRHWQASKAELASGAVVMADRLAVTAGHESFPLLSALFPLPAELGMPVKGQAALLDARCDPGQPLIFDDGVYIVPHADGSVAIGSTSENSFDAPFSTDAQLDGLLDRAHALCPRLADAPVIERWAGLRPRAIGRDPLVDLVPGDTKTVIATGGFKITLGIAHAMAKAALDRLLGRPVELPESFSIDYHLAKTARIKR
ncbi:FAD-dependent oxidoreductase [Rhizobium sp. EC-SD404]|uniref:NAD(P)/FAD-dependent oxidoreductase n=1 Tax=Rhizobium sp. EC-SD404 TaxID=2038389 RepID=UPI001251BC53|nr:FAD-dependent oxidoreductase [Rhizobium sp. EC-SD404]VVT23900.1 FAD dependent oxidoreductase [Rhizobium sp. EC-SD404]